MYIKLLFYYYDKHTTKSDLGRKGFVLSYSLQVIIQGSQGRRNLKQEPEGRSYCRDQGVVLCTGLLRLLSYTPQDHMPKGCATHQCVGPFHINHQPRKQPQTGHSYKGIFLSEVPSQMTLNCIKLT